MGKLTLGGKALPRLCSLPSQPSQELSKDFYDTSDLLLIAVGRHKIILSNGLLLNAAGDNARINGSKQQQNAITLDSACAESFIYCTQIPAGPV